MLDPSEPDYYTVSISPGVIAGLTFTGSKDRYGNIYLGVGGNVGKSLIPITVSWVEGDLDGSQSYLPDEQGMEGYLQGLAVNASAMFFLGGGRNLSPSATHTPQTAWERCGGIPQLGVSATWSWLVIDAQP